MKPFPNFGVFEKIQGPAFNETVHVSFDTIAWEPGAELDPEFVYEKCHIIERSSLADS